MPAGLFPDSKHLWTQLTKWYLSHGRKEGTILSGLPSEKDQDTIKMLPTQNDRWHRCICKGRPFHLSLVKHLIGSAWWMPKDLEGAEGLMVTIWMCFQGLHLIRLPIWSFSGSLVYIVLSARSKHIFKLTVDGTCSLLLSHNLWAGGEKTLVERFCC